MIYKTNVSLGINNFVVTAVDRAGNPSVWDKTILMDEDSLPDWYEANITGTDPLNADSDSIKTLLNEAANGIPDDQEDFDSDGLTNLQEFMLDTDPFSTDTDSDSLTDRFEVFKSGTYPTSNDTDSNNITDTNEDLDGDGLTNLQEQLLGTDPLDPDTDDYTLSDGYEANTLKTSPLSKDTDGDGLEDDSEIKLGTNSLVADSDGDGKPDGNESYIQTFKNETAAVEATINGVGDLSKSIVLVKDNSSVLMSNLPGVANTVDISASSQVNAVSIKIYYNESTLGGWLASRYLVFGDIRDLPSTALRGDAFDFTTTLVGLLLPVIGDSGLTVSKFSTFAKKFPDKILDVAKLIIKTFPSGQVRISALDEIYEGAASALKGKGVSEARIDELVNAGIKSQKKGDPDWTDWEGTMETQVIALCEFALENNFGIRLSE